MAKSTIVIPKNIYRRIQKHLFPHSDGREQVAFIFATPLTVEEWTRFEFKSWHLVEPHEYEYHSEEYVELKDEMRPKIIKKAFDLNTSIVELHSHPLQRAAKFSASDLDGFSEFVPHVWWRLRGKPYAALVFSRDSAFDGLVWIDDPRTPKQLTEIIVGRKPLCANSLTLGGERIRL